MGGNHVERLSGVLGSHEAELAAVDDRIRRDKRRRLALMKAIREGKRCADRWGVVDAEESTEPAPAG
jgi:hypothetical protein